MKICVSCKTELNDEARLCPTCGIDQIARPISNMINSSQGDTALVILCILTIIGSVFGMFRGWLYEVFAAVGNNSAYWRGWAFIIFNIGTLVGAIRMLQKKLTGLYIYTFAQGAYILLTLYTTFVYVDSGKEFGGVTSNDSSQIITSLAFTISMIFLVPSITFLVLYWLPFNRRHLN